MWRAAGSPIFRAIYRTVELADGWTGKVIQTQSLFSKSMDEPSTGGLLTPAAATVVFDGVMVFSTMLILNICHPGLILRTPPEPQMQEESVPMYRA